MVNSNASVRLLRGDRGRITADQISVHPDDVHKPITALVSVEDTSNRGGGCCYDIERLKSIRNKTRELGLAYHCDGARVMNAIVERDDNPAEYGALFDSISVCLSKGLGAPVGSLLIGSKDFVKKARRVRKVLGGGMRQAGILAAAGIYALNNNVDRLKEDHSRAKQIGEVLQGLDYVEEVLPVETNILVFRLNDSIAPSEYLQWLESKGVYAVPFGGQLIRFVTHLDFDDAQMNALNEIIRSR